MKYGDLLKINELTESIKKRARDISQYESSIAQYKSALLGLEKKQREEVEHLRELIEEVAKGGDDD